eukprot:jgi/Orpsp1_1/1187563/evm.model.d7180000058637.1
MKLNKSYVKAIDSKNIKKIKKLINKNSGKDLIFELYDKNYLSLERLKFLFKNCSSDINISFPFIKRLMKDDNMDLLDFIFENFNFFDNKFVLKLLFYYKSKYSISDSDLKQQILKYKLVMERNTSYYIYCNQSNKYLFSACFTGNIFVVKYFVEHGIDMDNEINNEYTPLHMACQNGHDIIVKYLIEQKTNVNKENIYRSTPLHYACKCKRENINCVKYLIEKRANINRINNMEYTPLHYACKNGHESIVNYLVEHGADINKETNIGTTALLMACESKHENINIVKYLVEHGADLNKVDIIGY